MTTGPNDQHRAPTKRANDRPVMDANGRRNPHDSEAELSVNATLLAYPQRWFDVCSWLRPEDYYDPRNGLVYSAIGHIVSTDGGVDPLTIRARLEQTGDWKRVGAECLERTMRNGAINEPILERVAAIVVDKAKKRRTIALAQLVANEGYGECEDDRAWADAVPGRFESLVRDRVDETGASARSTLTNVFTSWQHPEDTAAVRLGTGIPDLDALFRKMRPKQVIVIGAHSGIGKSALAANIVDHVATQERPEGLPAGVYVQSVEMSREEYIERMLFARAGVDTNKVDEDKRGFITDDEWAAITESAKSLAVDHIWIDDRADITPSQIRVEARRVQMRFARAGTPLRLIVIDYAQLINGDTENKRRADNREQEVAQVARAAKKIAKELNCTVILLAQLNEDSTKEKRRPRARDLRESRSLKQDADKVVLIYNPEYEARASAYRNGGQVGMLPKEYVDLIVDKNRGASTGTIAVTFRPSITKFSAFDGDERDLERLRNSGHGGRGDDNTKARRAGP